MGAKNSLLAYLEANRGEFCSGEEISKKLGVSRTMVWKRVKELQSQGYLITATRNRGYMLEEETDILSAEGIAKYLVGPASDLKIEVVDETESTNLDLRRRAEQGAHEGLVLLARRQTAGRGRRGRGFYSPDSGIYLSLLLRPTGVPATPALLFTTITAIAVCEAIEAFEPGFEARVKWVNDIIFRGRKVCGILTDGHVSMENMALEYMVVGVGANLYRPDDDFPASLQGIAGAISETSRGDGKNRFVAEFLNRFTHRRLKNDSADDLEQYRKRLLGRGRKATICLPSGKKRDATIIDVDDKYRLIVEYDDGTREHLAFGEISARPNELLDPSERLTQG